MAADYESGVTYGERAWHGEDNNLPADDPRRYSVKGTMEAGKMGWEVRKVQHAIASLPDVPEKYHGKIAKGSFGVYRTDNWTKLGDVGSTYECLQNLEMFEYFQPFLDSKELQFESAGALDGGKRVFVQASLAGDGVDLGGGDRILPKLLIAGSHDGSMKTSTLWTPERVVCANTLRMAMNNNTGILGVRHTKNQKKQMELVMKAIDVANQQFTANCEQFKELMACGISKNDLIRYVRKVLNITEADDEVGVSKAVCEKYDAIYNLALNGRGQEGEKLTAWSAYNGVTEYVSHKAGKDWNATRKSLWFGTGKALNQRALTIALQLAG